MKTPFLKISVSFALALYSFAEAQTYDTNNVSVGTFVGSGFAGFYDGKGTQTMFNSPSALVKDSSGNLLVFDSLNYRIRKITPDGTVSTVVGGGTGALPGYGTNVSLPYSFGAMTIDHSNVIWTVEQSSADFPITSVLLRISPDFYISKVPLNLGDPLDAFVSGEIGGMCVDSANNLYLAYNAYEYYFRLIGSQVVRYGSDGSLETIAGSSRSPGALDGNGVFSSFAGLGCLAVDAADNIYIWDRGNNLIRRMDQERNVVTLAGIRNQSSNSDGLGASASFSSVMAMCVDDYANVFLACSNCVRKLPATTNVVTVAGSFTESGYTNGPGDIARFSGASGICLQSNCLFVADTVNQRIRQISFGIQPPPAAGPSLSLGILPGLQITGLVGRQYKIESSVDAFTWNTEANLILNGSPFLWVDMNPGSRPKAYRAWLLP